MSDLLLYNYFRSSTSYRVRIVLSLKNLNFEYKPIHLIKNGGEQHGSQYRGLNPIGGVPTLVHNGNAISQSMAIIEYLDAVFPNPKLFPKSPLEGALVRQFCEHINSEMHPYANLKTLTKLEKDFGADQAKKDQWIQYWYDLGFTALEKLAAKTAGKYLFGDLPTAAEAFLIPQIFSAQRYQMKIENYPTLAKINQTCLPLAEFQSAHPHRQIDTPAEPA